CPQRGRCRFRTRASVPSRLSPNQLAASAATKVAAAQGVRGMSANAATAIGIETRPSSVRWSELMAAGIRRAIAVSSRLSGSARKLQFSRVWSITSPYPNAKRRHQPAHNLPAKSCGRALKGAADFRVQAVEAGSESCDDENRDRRLG